MELKTVQTQKIYKNIVEQIVDLIHDGSLKKGDKIPPERSLAEMLDVSRTSVREALKVMEIMGIIEIRPGEGSVVSDFNAEPFLSMIWPVILGDRDTETDLLEFRKILEEGSIRHLALKGENEEFFKDLKDIVNEMETSIDNCRDSVRLDILFHRKIFELTGNKLLMVAQNLVEYILEKTVKYNRSAAIKEQGSGLIIYKQHKSIYEAVCAGDSEEAVKRMCEHLDYVQSLNLSRQENFF